MNLKIIDKRKEKKKSSKSKQMWFIQAWKQSDSIEDFDHFSQLCVFMFVIGFCANEKDNCLKWKKFSSFCSENSGRIGKKLNEKY